MKIFWMKTMGKLKLLFLGVFLLDCSGLTEAASMYVGYDKCVEGNGKKAEESRKVDDFRKIDIEGAFNVMITSREKQGVTVAGDENLLPHIVTEVKGDTLFVYASKSICSKMRLEVHISSDDIAEVSASGSDTVSVSRIDNKEFSVKTSGSVDLKASGRTEHFSAEISDSSSLAAKELISDEVRVSVSGSASAHVHAESKLYAKSRETGDIIYSGNPKTVKKDITGVGDIEGE
jgi:hypothetical protein